MASLVIPAGHGNYRLTDAVLPQQRLTVTTSVALSEVEILAMLQVLRASRPGNNSVGFDSSNNTFFVENAAPATPF